MPAESSNPLTTSASDSCSESNTFTSFSLGSGRGCASAGELPGSAMTSPILESDQKLPDQLLHSDRFYSNSHARTHASDYVVALQRPLDATAFRSATNLQQ